MIVLQKCLLSKRISLILYQLGGNVDKSLKDPTTQSLLDFVRQTLSTWNTSNVIDKADQTSFELMDKFHRVCKDRNRSNMSSLEAIITKLEAIMATEGANDVAAFPTKALGYLASIAIFPLIRLDIQQVGIIQLLRYIELIMH